MKLFKRLLGNTLKLNPSSLNLFSKDADELTRRLKIWKMPREIADKTY